MPIVCILITKSSRTIPKTIFKMCSGHTMYISICSVCNHILVEGVYNLKLIVSKCYQYDLNLYYCGNYLK